MMSEDELPRDYSSLYSEDSNRGTGGPVASSRRSLYLSGGLSNNYINTMPLPHNFNQALPTNTLSHPQHKAIVSDGAKSNRIKSESTVDLRAVVAKLQNLPLENNRYAAHTISKHYSSLFNRRKVDQLEQKPQKHIFRAYIHYHDDKETYVVKVDRNILRAVREKLPKRGNFRYFFKQLDNTCEEVESDDSSIPFHEKDGFKQIYCQLFPL